MTGVPGAGKTLVGLNVAIKQFEKTEKVDNEMAVYLSGNGLLVDVLTESLARDKKEQADEKGEKCNITDARRHVKSFIQIHHYRKAYIAFLKDDGSKLTLVDGKLQVDEANPDDATRLPEFYDNTFEFLKSIGFEVI